MSKRLIALSDALESATTHGIDCSDKIEEALKALKGLGERPVKLKELAKLKDQIDHITTELEVMFDDTEEKRLGNDEPELSRD